MYLYIVILHIAPSLIYKYSLWRLLQSKGIVLGKLIIERATRYNCQCHLGQSRPIKCVNIYNNLHKVK